MWFGRIRYLLFMSNFKSRTQTISLFSKACKTLDILLLWGTIMSRQFWFFKSVNSVIIFGQLNADLLLVTPRPPLLEPPNQNKIIPNLNCLLLHSLNRKNHNILRPKSGSADDNDKNQPLIDSQYKVKMLQQPTHTNN